MVGPEFSEDIAQLKLDLEQQIEQDARIIEMLEKQRNFDDTIGAQMEHVTNSIQTLFNEAINSQASLDQIDALATQDHERGNTSVDESQATAANILEKLKPFQDELLKIQSLQADNKTMLFNFIASSKDQEGFEQVEQPNISHDTSANTVIVDSALENKELSEIRQVETSQAISTNSRVSRAFNPTKKNYLNIPLRNPTINIQAQPKPQMSEQCIQTDDMIIEVPHIEMLDQVIQTDQVRYVLIKPPANIQQNNRRRVIHDPSISPRQLQAQQQQQKEGFVVEFGGGVQTNENPKKKKVGVTVSSQASMTDENEDETMIGSNSAAHQRFDETRSNEENKHEMATGVLSSQENNQDQQYEQYEEYEYGDEDGVQEVEVPWYQLMEPVKIVQLADQWVQTIPQETNVASTQVETEQNENQIEKQAFQHYDGDTGHVPLSQINDSQIIKSSQNEIKFDQIDDFDDQFSVQVEDQEQSLIQASSENLRESQNEKQMTENIRDSQNLDQNQAISSPNKQVNNNSEKVQNEEKQIQTDFQPIRYAYRKQIQQKKDKVGGRKHQVNNKKEQAFGVEIRPLVDNQQLEQFNFGIEKSELHHPISPKDDNDLGFSQQTAQDPILNNDNESCDELPGPNRDKLSYQHDSDELSEQSVDSSDEDENGGDVGLIYIEDHGTQTEAHTNQYDYDTNQLVISNNAPDFYQSYTNQLPQTCPHCNYNLTNNPIQNDQQSIEQLEAYNNNESYPDQQDEQVSNKAFGFKRQNIVYRPQDWNQVEDSQTNQKETEQQELMFEAPKAENDSFSFDDYENEFSSNVKEPAENADHNIYSQDQYSAEQRESMPEPYQEVYQTNENKYQQQFDQSYNATNNYEENYIEKNYEQDRQSVTVQKVTQDTQTDELPNLELALELYAKTLADQASQIQNQESQSHSNQSPNIQEQKEETQQLGDYNDLAVPKQVPKMVDSETQYEAKTQNEKSQNQNDSHDNNNSEAQSAEKNNENDDDEQHRQSDMQQDKEDIDKSNSQDIQSPLKHQDNSNHYDEQNRASVNRDDYSVEQKPHSNSHLQKIKVKQEDFDTSPTKTQQDQPNALSLAKKGVDQDIQTDDVKIIENFNFEIQQTFSTDDNRLIAMKIFTKHMADQYEFLAESGRAPPASASQSVSINRINQGHRPPRGGYSSQQPLNTLQKQGGLNGDASEPKEVVEHFEIDITEEHYDHQATNAILHDTPLINEEYKTEIVIDQHQQNNFTQSHHQATSRGQQQKSQQRQGYYSVRTPRNVEEEESSASEVQIGDFRQTEGSGQQYYQNQFVSGEGQNNQYQEAQESQINTYQQQPQLRQDPSQLEYSTDYQQQNYDEYDSTLYQHDYNNDLKRFESTDDQVPAPYTPNLEYRNYSQPNVETDANYDYYAPGEDQAYQQQVKMTNQRYGGDQMEEYGAGDRYENDRGSEHNGSHVQSHDNSNVHNDSSLQHKQELSDPVPPIQTADLPIMSHGIDPPLNSLQSHNQSSSYQDTSPHQLPHTDNNYQQNYLVQENETETPINQNEMPQIGDEFYHQKPLMGSLQSHSLRTSNPNESEAIDDDADNSIMSPNRTNVSSSHQSSQQKQQQQAFRQKRETNNQRQQLQSQGPQINELQDPINEGEVELDIDMGIENQGFEQQYQGSTGQNENAQRLSSGYTDNQQRNNYSNISPVHQNYGQEFYGMNDSQAQTEDQNYQASYYGNDGIGKNQNQNQFRPEMKDQDTQTDQEIESLNQQEPKDVTNQECQTATTEYEEQSIQTINISTDSIEIQTEATSTFGTTMTDTNDLSQVDYDGPESAAAQTKTSHTIELQTSFDTDYDQTNQNAYKLESISQVDLQVNENSHQKPHFVKEMAQLDSDYSIVEIEVAAQPIKDGTTEIYANANDQVLSEKEADLMENKEKETPQQLQKQLTANEEIPMAITKEESKEAEQLQIESQTTLTKNQKKRKNKKNKGKKMVATKSIEQEEGGNNDNNEGDDNQDTSAVQEARNSQVNEQIEGQEITVEKTAQSNTVSASPKNLHPSPLIQTPSTIQSGIINIMIEPIITGKHESVHLQTSRDEENDEIQHKEKQLVDQNLSAIETQNDDKVKAEMENADTQTEKDEENALKEKSQEPILATQLVQTSPVKIIDESDDETITEIMHNELYNQKPQLLEQQTQTDEVSNNKGATGFRQKPGQANKEASGLKQSEFTTYQQPTSSEQIFEYRDDQLKDYGQVRTQLVNLTGSEDIDLDFQNEIQDQQDDGQQFWNKVDTPGGRNQFGNEFQEENPNKIKIEENDYYGSKKRIEEENEQLEQQLLNDEALEDLSDNGKTKQISSKATIGGGGPIVGVSPSRMPDSKMGGTSRGANDDEILTYTDQDPIQLDQQDANEKSPMPGLNKQFNIRKQQSRRERGLMSEVPQQFKTVGGPNAENDSTSSPYKNMYEKTPTNNTKMNQREFISEQMMSPETVSLDSSHMSSEEFKGNFHHPRLGGQLHKIGSTNAGNAQQQSALKSQHSNPNFDDGLSNNPKEEGGEQSTKNTNKQFILKQNTNVIDIQEDEDGLVTDETKSAEQGIDEQTQTDGVVLVTTAKELHQGENQPDVIIVIDREDQSIQTDVQASSAPMPSFQRQKSSGFKYISLQKSRDAPLQQHSQRYRDINEEEEYKIQEALSTEKSLQKSRSLRKKVRGDDDEVMMGDEQDQSQSLLLRDTILNRDLSQVQLNNERLLSTIGTLQSGDLIFVEGQELDVDIFMIKDFTLLASLSTDQNQMTCAVCINGTIFIGCANSQIYAFTLKGFQRVKEILTQQVCCCFLDYKGEALFCGERKGVIEIIDVKEGSKTNSQKLKTFTLPNMKHIISLSKSVRDDELVLASESGIYFALVVHDEVDGYSIVLQDESYFEGQSIIAAIEYEPMMLVLCLENQNGEIDVYIVDRNKRQAVKKIEVSQCAEGGEGAIIMRLMPNFDIKTRPYLFIRDDQEITFIDLHLFEQYTVIISTNTEDPQQSYQLELRSKEDEEAIDYIVSLYNEGDCSEMKKIEFFTRLLFQ